MTTDRLAQMNKLHEMADTISYYGGGTADEMVKFFEADGSMPEWYDEHDRGLLVEMVEELIS